jgi:exosome complex component RRP42
MAPGVSQVQISPAELSYLHASLLLEPPIRPDGRSPVQFRPLIAEDDILPSTNGSARVCFADGIEAIVGVKAEVQKSDVPMRGSGEKIDSSMADGGDEEPEAKGEGQNQWVEVSIEIPGQRDDDPLPLFLAALLSEALLSSGELKDRLWINRRFHWKLYIDVCSVICATCLNDANVMAGSTTLATTLIPSPTTIHNHSSRFTFGQIANPSL